MRCASLACICTRHSHLVFKWVFMAHHLQWPAAPANDITASKIDNGVELRFKFLSASFLFFSLFLLYFKIFRSIGEARERQRNRTRLIYKLALQISSNMTDIENWYLRARVNFYGVHPNVFIDLELSPRRSALGRLVCTGTTRLRISHRARQEDRGRVTGTGKGRRPCILSRLSLRRSIPTVSLESSLRMQRRACTRA